MRSPRFDRRRSPWPRFWVYLSPLFLLACTSPYGDSLDLGGALPNDADPAPGLAKKKGSAKKGGAAKEFEELSFKQLATPQLASLVLSPDTADDVMARVSGVEIRKHHIVDRLAEIEPAQVYRVLELLILDQRVKELAQEHAVFVPDEELRLAEGRDWAGLRRLFRKRRDKDENLERYLLRNHAMDIKQYRERSKKLAWRRLLRAYTIRYVHKRRGSLELLYLVSEDRDTAQACRNRVRRGADFATLCRHYSIDPSRKVGGKLPMIPNDFDHPAAALAKGVEKDDCSRVRKIEYMRGKSAYAFVQVVSRTEADDRAFKDVWREIRDGLAVEGISPRELQILVSGR